MPHQTFRLIELITVRSSLDTPLQPPRRFRRVNWRFLHDELHQPVPSNLPVPIVIRTMPTPWPPICKKSSRPLWTTMKSLRPIAGLSYQKRSFSLSANGASSTGDCNIAGIQPLNADLMPNPPLSSSFCFVPMLINGNCISSLWKSGPSLCGRLQAD